MWRRQPSRRALPIWVLQSRGDQVRGLHSSPVARSHPTTDPRATVENVSEDIPIAPSPSVSSSSSSMSAPHANAELTMSQGQLHAMLRTLAQTAAARPPLPSAQTPVTSSRKVPPLIHERARGDAQGSDDFRHHHPQELHESAETRAASSHTPIAPGLQRQAGAEKELLTRLLLAKRAARPASTSSATRRRLSSSTSVAASPSAGLDKLSGDRGRPTDGTATAASRAVVSSAASPWQEALTLFFDAIHDHAVTPTAQHFNLLLQLTTHNHAWSAVDYVEEYYARFLVSVRELREGKQHAIAQARQRALDAYAQDDDAVDDLDEDDTERIDKAATSSVAHADATVLGADVVLRRQLGDLEAAEEALRPNSQTFHVLMRGALARRRWPLVLDYFDSMRDFGLVISDDTIQYVLAAHLMSVTAAAPPTESSALPLRGSSPSVRRPQQTERRETPESTPEQDDEATPVTDLSRATLRAVLHATRRPNRSAVTGERQRLASNQRGPQLRAAAQPALSVAEEAQKRTAAQRHTHGGAASAADVAFSLVRDYCYLVTQPRTVWLMVSLLQQVHTPASSRRLVEVYQMFPHLLQQHALRERGAAPTGARLAVSSEMACADREGTALSLTERVSCASSWSSPSSSSMVLALSSPEIEAPYMVWIWLAVSAAACELGDWVVTKAIWQRAVATWTSRDAPFSTVGAFSAHTPPGVAEVVARASARQAFLLDVVQPLLVNTLHALRRVRRYTDMLALYQKHNALVPSEADTEFSARASVSALAPPESTDVSGVWSPAALVLVAQAATALQRMDVLLQLIAAEAAVVATEVKARRHQIAGVGVWPAAGAAVPLPPDVYESALRTHQMQCVLQRQPHSAASPSPKSQAASVEARRQAEDIYAAYLASARAQLDRREDAERLGLRESASGMLLTREHEPLLHALFALTRTAPSTTTTTTTGASASSKAPWQEAMAHVRLIRRPDALHMALIADILCTTVRQLRASAGRVAALGEVADAAGALLDRLLADLPDDAVLRSGSTAAPASVAAWKDDAATTARVRLAAQLARVHVGELATGRLLTALTLAGQPFRVLARLPQICALVWLSDEAAAQQRQQAQHEVVEKSRADLRRAQQEEQQLAAVMSRSHDLADMESAAPVRGRDETRASVARPCAPVSAPRPLEGGEATQLLMTLCDQYAHGDATNGTALTRENVTAEQQQQQEQQTRALRVLLTDTAQLVQQLQHSTSSATPAFETLLADIATLRRVVAPDPPHLLTSAAEMPPCAGLDASVVWPVIVDAVLEQVSLSTTSRCTLWRHCLTLLTATLTSPFVAPQSVSTTAEKERTRETMACHRDAVFVSAATLPLLTRFVRYCDRAERDFVDGVVLGWLRPAPLPTRPPPPLLLSTDAAMASSCRAGWELALEALVWACRRREKALARDIYHALQGPCPLLLQADARGDAHDGPCDVLAPRVRFAQLALLQCLTSGTHEDVLKDWSTIQGLFMDLLHATAGGVAPHSAGVPVAATRRGGEGDMSQTEAATLADALAAVCVKVQKTLHHLFVRLALDTHRHRYTSSSSSSSQRRSRRTDDALAALIVETEAMASAFQTLLGPLTLDDDATPVASPRGRRPVADEVDAGVSVDAVQLIPDILLPLCAAFSVDSPHRVQRLDVRRVLHQAVQAAWEALYSEYVWRACFKHGDHGGHGTPPEAGARVAMVHHRMTLLLQIEVEFCPTAATTSSARLHSTDDTEVGLAWAALRERLSLWAVVTAHMAPRAEGSVSTSATATAVARACNHLTTLEAFLGARADVSSSMVPTHQHNEANRAAAPATKAEGVRTVPVLFLEVVRDLTDDVMRLTTPAAAMTTRTPSRSSFSSAASLPPLPDGSAALSRFQSPASLLSVGAAPLSLLHDITLHLLYVALCEESVPRRVLLNPSTVVPVRKGSRHHVSATHDGVSFSDAGLLPSALTWCCGSSTARYADVLHACGPLFPDLVQARCTGSENAQSEEAQETTAEADARALPEPVPLMGLIFERLAGLGEWQLARRPHSRSSVAVLSPPSFGAHAPQLLSCLLSTPQNIYGEDIRMEGPMLSEPVAASALMALSVALVDLRDDRAAASKNSLLALQQAERLLRAFPTLVVRECLPRWAAGGYSTCEITGMDVLCARLWCRASRSKNSSRGASPAVHRAVLTWFVVVHGTWPVLPGGAEAPGASVSALTWLSDSPVTATASSTHAQHDRSLLTMDALGGLTPALQAWHRSGRVKSARQGRPGSEPFAWPHWTADLPSMTVTVKPVTTPPNVPTTEAAAQAMQCLTATAAAQLLDLAFPAPSATPSRVQRASPVSSDVVTRLIARAGNKLDPVRRESLQQMNDAARSAASAHAQPSHTSSAEAAQDSTREDASPVHVLVRALMHVVVTASITPSSVGVARDLETLLRAVRDRLAGEDGDTINNGSGDGSVAVARALVDWGAFHHALTAAAALSTNWGGEDELTAGALDPLAVGDAAAVQKFLDVAGQALFDATMKDAADTEDAGGRSTSELVSLCQSTLLAVMLCGAPSALTPRWLLATYTQHYRPALAQASASTCRAWGWFVSQCVRPLFVAHASLCDTVLARGDRQAAQSWAPLLHLLAIDLTGLELTVVMGDTRAAEADTQQRVARDVDAARTALVDVQSRWTSWLALPDMLRDLAMPSSSSSSPASSVASSWESVRAWSAVSLLLGSWREPLHVFQLLAAVGRTQTETPTACNELGPLLGAVAMLVVCAAMPHATLTPAVLNDLLDGLQRLETSTATDSRTGVSAGQVVRALHATVAAAHRAAPSVRTRRSPVAVRVVRAMPLAHALAATEAHAPLREAFFRLVTSVEPDSGSDAEVWARLRQAQETHTPQLASTSSDSPGSLSEAWSQVQRAIQVLEGASDETLRRFVANESRRRGARRSTARSSGPSSSSAKQVHGRQGRSAAQSSKDEDSEVSDAALVVKHAWSDLVDGLAAAAALGTAGRSDMRKDDAAKLVTLREDVLRVLTSPTLAVIPHTIHFIPLSLSESLVQVVCSTWTDGMRLLRFSLSTLRKTHGRPTPVQQYMACLILQRVRQDPAFASQVEACACAIPEALARWTGACREAEVAETHTLNGAAALAATCVALVALPPQDAAAAATRPAGPTSAMTPASATPSSVVPQRVLMEALRLAATDVHLSRCLYHLAWQQPYTRLEGPHAFLSLLRAARLSQSGELGVQVMADFFAVVGADGGDSTSPSSVLPAPADVVVAWRARVPATRLSPEAHRVVWKAFARLCGAHLVTAQAAQEVLARFRTIAILSDVEELLVTVHFARFPQG